MHPFLLFAAVTAAACTVRFNPPEPAAAAVGPPDDGDGDGDGGAAEGQGGAAGDESAAGGAGEGEGEVAGAGAGDPDPCVPTLEVCDGRDDDCDGSVDEADDGSALRRPCYGGPPETDGVGVCRAGARVCEGGGYDEAGACPDQVMPVRELGADALDNDCDGLEDEGFSSLLFEGRFDSRVTLPDDRQLALAETSFTVEAWVRPDEISYFRSNTIVSRRLDDGSEGWLFGVSGRGNFDNLPKRVPFFLVDGWPDDDPDLGRFIAAPANHALRDGQWAHLAAVYDAEAGEEGAGRMRLYVDGQLAAAEDLWTRAPHDSPQSPEAWIGADQTVFANAFDGRIADLRVTAARRYNGPFRPDPCPGAGAPDEYDGQVVGHWRLSEASGESALDASGRGMHGELSGVTWQAGEACGDRGNQ